MVPLPEVSGDAAPRRARDGGGGGVSLPKGDAAGSDRGDPVAACLRACTPPARRRQASASTHRVAPGRSGRQAAALRRVALEVLLDSGERIAVSGDCMAPAVPEGASLRVMPCRPGDLAPGDVVLVERGRAFCLHRLLGTVGVGRGRRLLCKADRGRRPDPPAPLARLVGRLDEVVVDGVARRYAPGRWDRVRAAGSGFFWGVVAPFLREARDFLRTGRDREGSRAAEAPR
jgi:hypothetical protein